MAVWSLISLGEIENNRIDAEFYQPKYLEASNKVDTKKLKHYGISVIHPSEVKRSYSSDGLQIVLGQNNRNNYYDWSVKKFMPISMNVVLSKNKLHYGDVTVTRSGANYGQTSVITIETEKKDYFACADLLILKTNNISGPLVSTYLNSDVGKKLMVRGVYGAGQPHVAPKYVKEIPFPEYLIRYSEDIDKLIISSRKKSQDSENFYKKAKELLEIELRLEQLLFPKENYSIGSFSSVVSDYRLDAQHFQKKFDILLDHIQKFSNTTIKERKIINRRGLQPKYLENGKIRVVTSQHITSTHLAYNELEKTSLSGFEKSREAHIKKNDLLIYTTGAYIGQTNIYDSDLPAMASNHVNILRVDGIESGYLSVLMPSIIGKLQTEKHSRGSAQAELYPSDIDKFVIPLIDSNKQIEISNLLRDSLLAKKESEQLLAQAKKQVEDLIEGAVR